VKWKLEIEMKLLEKMELELNFFQNGNNTDAYTMCPRLSPLKIMLWCEPHVYAYNLNKNVIV